MLGCSLSRSVGIGSMGGQPVGSGALPLVERDQHAGVGDQPFGLGDDLAVAEREVECDTPRLAHLPRRDDVHLDHVVLGVAEVDAPAVAVVARLELGAAVPGRERGERAQVVEAPDPERHLAEHLRGRFARPAAHEHHLVVLTVRPGEEREVLSLEVALIADHHAEHLGVERDHPLGVVHEDPEVGELGLRDTAHTRSPKSMSSTRLMAGTSCSRPSHDGVAACPGSGRAQSMSPQWARLS